MNVFTGAARCPFQRLHPIRFPVKNKATSLNNQEARKIPKAVIKRLSLYSRILQNLALNKIEKISSSDLGARLGFNSAQVRKDLANFGQFGVPGFGYHVSDLRREIRRILGTDRHVAVGLVGVGNLGRALLSYAGFARQGFHIVAGFDVDPTRGQDLGVPVHPMDQLEDKIHDLNIEIVALTVPAEACPAVVERLVAAGVPAILNFVPCRLDVPTGVVVHYVDLALEMESLSYYINK